MNVYTFNKTIYDGDCGKDFFFFCLKGDKKLIKYLPGQLLRYALGVAAKGKFKKKLYCFLEGVEDVDAQARLFWEAHESNIMMWFPDYRTKDDFLISTSPEFLLEPIAKKMNFTLMGTKVDKYTGVMTGKYCYS